MPIANTETGEIENNHFVKMIMKDVGLLFNLGIKEFNVLMLMLKSISNPIRGDNRVVMTTAKRKQFAEKLGYTTHRTINEALHKLAAKGIIKLEEEGSVGYIVNPDLFFVGNEYQHVAVISTYFEGKRRVRVVDSKGLEEIRNELDA